ncbi:GNAT family N-acetyltransferase [candidate division CSSED10-310 bacterium]|uniref:GNAT family N-acetyltransferase n=1 Tax=candidate division CSSED10-310 bacterium TaxID=2855610 RepID=A0ABV6Z6N8_UNCC1
METLINPPNMNSEYLKALNFCFNSWGDLAMFHWCFTRTIGGLSNDIIVIKENDELIAGSGVTYRPIRIHTGIISTVGIMTGSFTLPASRGKGCFTEMIKTSKALCAQKGVALLLAFVTADNASFRRLANAGSALYPTWYLFNQKASPDLVNCSNFHVINPDDDDVTNRIFELSFSNQKNKTHFTYTYDEWKSQFIHRPSAITIISFEEANYCLMDEKSEVIKILALYCSQNSSIAKYIQIMQVYAARQNKKLYVFTASECWKEYCVQAGFKCFPGYMTVLITNHAAYKDIVVNKYFSHELDESVLIPSKHHVGILGPWTIQSGDRM